MHLVCSVLDVLLIWNACTLKDIALCANLGLALCLSSDLSAFMSASLLYSSDAPNRTMTSSTMQREKMLKMSLCLVLQAEQEDRVLSTSEDPLPCLHNSKADSLIRSRPLSDIFPFHSDADKSATPYLLSGCAAQVQPITAGPEESRLNGINAWSNPVIGQPEGKPYSSRIMKLFSNSKKGPSGAHGTTTDSSSSTHCSGSNGGPQVWPGLSGLGVVDSFKKLRSSVLQGIQSKGAINDGEHMPSSSQHVAAGAAVASTDPGLDEVNSHLKFTEEYSVSNGNFMDPNLAVMSECESDIEDYYDDEEDNEGGGLARNTRFSRSIRRAYGAGRISLFDTGNERLSERSANDGQKRDQSSKVNAQLEKINEKTNVKVLSRLSKSAENLHIFKAPFRRRAPSSGHSLTDGEPQRAPTSHRTPNIQRTASASSVDLPTHTGNHRTSAVKTKGSMLKLVGSMTDLTVRFKQSPSPSPTSPSLMSPLSRLHDDYSRRVPCLTTSERQRRPSPVRARVLSVGHTPLVHPQPECDVNPQQHQPILSPVFVEPPERMEPTSLRNAGRNESPTEATTCEADCESSPLGQKEPSQQQGLTEVSMQPNKVRKHMENHMHKHHTGTCDVMKQCHSKMCIS